MTKLFIRMAFLPLYLADVQAEILCKINGLERTRIIRPGYAIEYDYVDPRELNSTLETKKINHFTLRVKLMEQQAMKKLQHKDL